MFLTLGVLLFSGYPVAFILGGLALLFGFIGFFLGSFKLVQFFNFVPRIWGQAAENLVLVAIPTFIFMGVMMERSGIAQDLLYCVQVLLKRVPGALALGVTIMGTILAAMTGIIGASVTMMTALALPTMMKQGYSHALACGTIAAAGTLGILIPPSIMLIIMADLMGISVGNLFSAAIVPGLSLAALYLLFVFTRRQAQAVARAAAAARPADGAQGKNGAAVVAGVLPAGAADRDDQVLDPVRLGDAERGGRGRRAGAILLAALWGRLDFKMMERCAELGTHHLDGVLHHHQRHLLRVRLPRPRRRRHRRAPDPGGGTGQLGIPVPGDGRSCSSSASSSTGSRSR